MSGALSLGLIRASAQGPDVGNRRSDSGSWAQALVFSGPGRKLRVFGLGVPDGSVFATESWGWLGSGGSSGASPSFLQWVPGLRRARYHHLGNGFGGEISFRDPKQGLVKFFDESQRVNIFLFGDHMVPLTTTELC